MSLKISQSAHFCRTFTQSDFDRFALLSGDDNPIHVDPQFSAVTRFGRTVAHGMFLYSSVCRVLGSQLPGPGTLQIEQELRFPAPTYTGEEVKFELTITDLPAPGMARISTLVTRAGGEVGLEGSALVRLPGAAGVPPTAPLHAAPSADSAASYKSLSLGQSVSIRRVYKQSDLEEYVDLVGDTNPIWNDDEFAQRLGFAGRIIPGGLLAGLFSYLLGVKLPGRGTNWLKQKLVFPGAAYPDEELTAKVEIIRLRPDKDLVNLYANVTRPGGELACEGESLVYVRDLETTGAK